MEEEKNKYPAFMFYPMDFITDDKVLAMPNEVLGIYIKLLCHDWINDGIEMKNEANLMVRVCFMHHNLDGSEREEGDKETILEHIRGCFMPHPEKEGYSTNPRLYKYRCQLGKRSATASKNGSKGGRPLKDKPNNNLNETKPKPKKSYSLSDSVSISDSITDSKKKNNKPPAPCSAGAKDLAKWMLNGFRTINPKFEAPRLALWANTIQAELSNGKSDYDIRAVFDFAISDDFWSGGGFKSPSGLFKHWNTITIKMHQTKKSGPDKKFEDNMSGIKKSWQKEIEKEKANGKDNLPKGLDAFDRLKAHNEAKRIGK